MGHCDLKRHYELMLVEIVHATNDTLQVVVRGALMVS